MIVVYAGRRLIRYINKNKKKSSAKKATVLKEIVEEATKPPTAPPQMMTTQFGPPVTTIAIPQKQKKTMENAIIPVNMARMPIFSNNLYD